jgi:CheY-like chemotaxis protein
MTHVPTALAPTVLVVEDEALLLFVIADELRDAGFIVFEASDADQAIRELENHPEIKLLFTDIDMPGSMDGLRLSAAVRDRWPPVKIVITSGKTTPSKEHMPTDGIFIPKPYTPEMIAATLHDLSI